MKDRNRRTGRPPKFVLDPNSRPIVGLSYNKANRCYYATYSKPRVYFGTGLADALFKFRKWENQQAIEEPYMELSLPNPPGSEGSKIVKWSECCGKRVNVLWPETKKALDEYLDNKKHNSDYVFTSQFGTLFAPHDVQRCFGRLRKKAGVPDNVKFNNFRDGAASALFGKVESDMLKVRIGHRIKGEKSKYISVKPEQVKPCADIIHKEYLG